MSDKDDKPLPNLDPPSLMEPLLKRIAEGVERLEKKQPPSVPPSMADNDAPAMPPSSRSVDQTPANLSPQQFANAGNINIEASKGQQQPSVFGRAAISLQSMTNMMADYGIQSSPFMNRMTSYAKIASRMAGDEHTRGEGLAGKGLRPSTGGDEQSLWRAMQLQNRGRDSPDEAPDASPQIARNDLKDSLDGLKEAIDQLKETLRQGDQAKASGPKTDLRQAEAVRPQAGAQRRSQPTRLASVNPQAVQDLIAAFRV